MWKREETVRSAGSVAGGDVMSDMAIEDAGKKTGGVGGSIGRDVVNIGKSVIIKGELSGSENLTIEGQVDGKIQLSQHVLTIGPNGKIKAEVFAKSVIVMGEVNGNITATDKINIRENGSVDGDIKAPRVAIAEGAHFRGSIDMQRSQVSKTGEAKGTVKPATGPKPAQVARVVQ